MERLYIRMLDGKPFEHPITESNLLAAFPDLNLNNLPSWLAKFERHDPSGIEVGGYENLVEDYVVSGKVVRDNWHTRPMSPEEKARKLSDLKAENRPSPWELDEDQGKWVVNLNVSGSAPDAL